MGKKRYTLKSTCPQCGCTDLTVLSAEEIRAKYGDAPNIHLTCGECMLQFEKKTEEVCPEWAGECALK